MRKAGILSILFVVVLLDVAVIAEAQPQAKVSKIGWLSARPASNSGQEVIVRMLRGLGYVEGKDIAFEYRYANNKLDGLCRSPSCFKQRARGNRAYAPWSRLC